MSVSIKDVRYIAALARLEFTPEEEERLARELSEILTYMDKLDELDTDGVEPMSHVLDLYNVLRDDRVQQRITREEALSRGPDVDDTYFRVPRIIE